MSIALDSLRIAWSRRKTSKEYFSPSISVSIISSEHFRYFRILFQSIQFSKQFERSKDAIRILRCSWILTGKGSKHLCSQACAVANVGTSRMTESVSEEFSTPPASNNLDATPTSPLSVGSRMRKYLCELKVSLPRIGLLRLTDKLQGACMYRGDMINNALGSKCVRCVWKQLIQSDTRARVTITISHIRILFILQVACCPGHTPGGENRNPSYIGRRRFPEAIWLLLQWSRVPVNV